MAHIDADGLFNGDRLRRCSNAAQLHWPRLFLASDGFARLEINYARIIGRAYPTFNPLPSETELQSWIQEYVKNSLLFLYEVDGQLWGQWDTRSELLPRYKTAVDRRSPFPPEPAYQDWKRAYRERNKAFPKCFGEISGALQHGVGVGVGVGVGKNICASPNGNARRGASFSTENGHSTQTHDREPWFAEWWSEYWLHKAKKAARDAFMKHVRTEARFREVMTATRAQKPEMLAREAGKRPHGATWLNGERWTDELLELEALPDSLYTPAEVN